MKSGLIKLIVCSNVVFLTACTSGNTYGTGSSHEEQTLISLSNILSISPEEKPKIDYSSRPGLVMPANTETLPPPIEKQGIAEDSDWPVSPEQRIAAIRSNVPQADREGTLPAKYLSSKKEGIRISSKRNRSKRYNDRGGDLLEEIRRGNDNGVDIKKLRTELSYSTGIKRKYLTEPPAEYRIPSENAEAGNLGVTKEELTARQKSAKEERRASDHGTLTVN